MTQNRVVLCILDGWGLRPELAEDDATQAATFFWQLWKRFPHTSLDASGQAVGLPDGQPGNSEVGHTVMGLGRVPLQPIIRVDQALEQGALLNHPEWKQALQRAREHQASLHLWGLLSTGGTHSHLRHWQGLLVQLANEGLPLNLHIVVDGRDVAPKTAATYLSALMASQPDNVQVASLCGRFFAMDRDQRWDRTEDAYRLVVEQKGYLTASSWQAVFEDSYYESLLSDEFLEPTVIEDASQPSSEDLFLSMNFRADRARQMIRALGDPSFEAFFRPSFPRFRQLFSLMDYAEDFRPFCTPLLEKETTTHSLGEILSQHGISQLRLAESEKYAHVTFFLNGGREEPFDGEERILVPSPQVTTYNLAPEMSAERITCEALKSLQAGSHQVIMMNYANADMLGHTGHIKAAEKSVRALDFCLQHLVAEARKQGATLLITADHGNAEVMLTAQGQPHTSHTTNPVPFLVVDPSEKTFSLRKGTLADVAPTVLTCLGIRPPELMAGRSLFVSEEL